jgi:hypothetical protein
MERPGFSKQWTALIPELNRDMRNESFKTAAAGAARLTAQEPVYIDEKVRLLTVNLTADNLEATAARIREWLSKSAEERAADPLAGQWSGFTIAVLCQCARNRCTDKKKPLVYGYDELSMIGSLILNLVNLLLSSLATSLAVRLTCILINLWIKRKTARNLNIQFDPTNAQDISSCHF